MPMVPFSITTRTERTSSGIAIDPENSATERSARSPAHPAIAREAQRPANAAAAGPFRAGRGLLLPMTPEVEIMISGSRLLACFFAGLEFPFQPPV